MWVQSLLDRIPSCHTLRRARTEVRRRPTRRLAVETLEDKRTPAAMLTVSDATVVEGNDDTQIALVTVSLTEPHGNKVTVNYKTVDGSAKAGSDYETVNGKLIFPRGVNSRTVLIPMIGDRIPDIDTAFSVQLSNGKGAKILRREGFVTVMDDEPRVYIDDAWIAEGNAATTPGTFTISLSTAYDWPVTVNYNTADGSASAGTDYQAVSDSVTFEPGQTSHPVAIDVFGDELAESNQTFLVNLTSPDSYAAISKDTGMATIVDDEPRIFISDVWNYGESTFTFTVSLSADHSDPVTVDFTTMDGTAIAGVDYVANFGTLTFAPGVLTQTITVQVLDPTSMPDKWFTVQLTNASENSLLGNEVAFGYWYYDYGYYDPGYYDPGYYDWYYYYW